MSKDCRIQRPVESFELESPDVIDEVCGAVDYSGALARVRACVRHRIQRVQEEGQEAAQRVGELLRQPNARRQWMVRNSSRYRSWYICDWILAHGARISGGSPKEGLELAQLALQMTEELDPEVHGGGPIGDLKSMAMAQVGNCFRLMGRRKEAVSSFGLARRTAERGSGDQLVSARILCLEALLLVDYGRVSEALIRLDLAQKMYSGAGDGPGAGGVLAIRGSLFLRCGNPTGAAWALRRAERCIDGEEDLNLGLRIRQELIACSLLSGELSKANQLLQGAKVLLDRIPQEEIRHFPRWFLSALEQDLGAPAVADLRMEELSVGFSAFWP